MNVVLMMFPTDVGIQPVELATEAEAEVRGFDALWFPEHSHIPASRRTPRSGIPGAGPLPEEYWRTHDQFLALAAAAARTSSLKLGTAITLVAQRDPIWLAKEVATLDHLSNGRFQFGIGYGWNYEEMEGHGVDLHRRRKIVREKVLACRELWTKDEASFAGDFVRFEPSWAWPKPTQKPHPPNLVGASPEAVHLDHIVEFADTWLPLQGRYDVGESWSRLQNLASDRGRDPATLDLGVIVPPPGATDRQNLAGLRDLGASFVALMLPPLDRDAALAALDSYGRVLEQFSAVS